jgi:hypothetical protein
LRKVKNGAMTNFFTGQNGTQRKMRHREYGHEIKRLLEGSGTPWGVEPLFSE